MTVDRGRRSAVHRQRSILLTIRATSWYHQPAFASPAAGLHLLPKERRISANEFRVNETIRVSEVRLIGPTGDNVGVVPVRQALQMARDAELDLVEVAPNTTPPVCRIMDFGKFLYEREKKEREARKAQTKVEIKEIRLRPKTTDHHRDFKVDDARRWLEHNMKVRVTIRFRGREITYPEIALEDLKEIAQKLSDISVVEQTPAIEGRAMSMLLAPSKGGTKKKAKEGAEEVPQTSEQPQE
jgi:translation initiation factor IF-3